MHTKIESVYKPSYDKDEITEFMSTQKLPRYSCDTFDLVSQKIESDDDIWLKEGNK
jgi:hypothetical protein